MKNYEVSEKVNFMETVNSDITVHVAHTPIEKKEIYKFRYQVFVEEMGKSLQNTVQRCGMIIDAMDEQSLLLYAQDSSGIIGTIRLTFGNAKQFPQVLSKTFCMDKFQLLGEGADKELCLITKLAVKGKYRGSQVLYMLTVKGYEIFRLHHTKFAFGGCNPHLIVLNEQLGFRRFTRNFTDPGYGLLVPFVMVVEDIEHFSAIRSPFYRVARKLQNDSQWRQKLLCSFPEAKQYINSQLVSTVELWKAVNQKLGKSPLKVMPLLTKLSEDEAATFLHFGVILPCFEDDRIVSHGEVSNEIFFLLSGVLLSENADGTHLIQPGQSFGGTGLKNPCPQSETVSAVIDSEILVVSRQGFEKFCRRYPNAGKQIMQNFLRLTNSHEPSKMKYAIGGLGHE